jgi:general stress protein YciG
MTPRGGALRGLCMYVLRPMSLRPSPSLITIIACKKHRLFVYRANASLMPVCQNVSNDDGVKIMAGTTTGGHKAAATNKQRYGLQFYEQIGRKGGKISRGGGFAVNRELAVEAGRKGGKSSRRKKTDATE